MNPHYMYHFDDGDWSGNTWQITALIGGLYRAERFEGGHKIRECYLSANKCAVLLGVRKTELPLPRLNRDMKALKLLPKLPKRTKSGNRIIYQLKQVKDLLNYSAFFDDIFSRTFDDGRIERLYKVGGEYLCFGIYADEDDDYDKIPLNKWVLVAYDYRNPLP